MGVGGGVVVVGGGVVGGWLNSGGVWLSSGGVWFSGGSGVVYPRLSQARMTSMTNVLRDIEYI